MSRKPGKDAHIEVRQWLIDLRAEKKMTQGQVAMAVGIAQPSYYQIERGMTNPKPETAMAIAQVLDFDWTRFWQ